MQGNLTRGTWSILLLWLSSSCLRPPSEKSLSELHVFKQPFNCPRNVFPGLLNLLDPYIFQIYPNLSWSWTPISRPMSSKMRMWSFFVRLTLRTLTSPSPGTGAKSSCRMTQSWSWIQTTHLWTSQPSDKLIREATHVKYILCPGTWNLNSATQSILRLMVSISSK